MFFLCFGWVLCLFSPPASQASAWHGVGGANCGILYILYVLQMQVKSKGVVLRVQKYNDEAQIVDVFTEQEGRVGFLVRISRSRRSAVRNTLFQPLSLVELEWNHRVGGGLQRLKGAAALPLLSIPYEPYKASIALFLAEFLSYAVREEQDSRWLFAYVIHSVEWLDACSGRFSNFHLVFLLQLSRFLGFYPNLSLSGKESFVPEEAYFDLESGCFVMLRPQHSHFVEAREARLLPLLMRLRYETMHLLRLSGAERSRLLGVINEYYRLHIPGFPELKSMAVLRELFGGE